MARLLQTRLPQANGEVDPATYNRLVRIFNAGDVIWNNSEDTLQLWTGQEWLNISTPTTKGVGATGSVASLTVSANGATVVSLL